MTITVNHLQAVTEPASAFRRVLSAMFARTSATTSRDGVLPGGLAVSDGPSGMQTIAGPGHAMIASYLLTVDANVTLTHDAGGASSRTDLIVARVYDQEAGDASSTGAIEIVKGTTTAEPALPAKAVRLSAVTVPAGANTLSSTSLTDRRDYTGAAGPIWGPGLLASAPSGLVEGSLVYDPQADQLGIVESGAWVKFLRDLEIDNRIAAAVPASLSALTNTGPVSIATQGAWVQVGMVSTEKVIGTGWGSPSGFTAVPATGWYALTAAASFAADPDGRRGINLVNSAGTPWGAAQILPATPTGSTTLVHTAEAWLTAGDQVRLALFQDSGGALSVSNLRVTARLAVIG